MRAFTSSERSRLATRSVAPSDRPAPAGQAFFREEASRGTGRRSRLQCRFRSSRGDSIGRVSDESRKKKNHARTGVGSEIMHMSAREIIPGPRRVPLSIQHRTCFWVGARVIDADEEKTPSSTVVLGAFWSRIFSVYNSFDFSDKNISCRW